MTESGSCGVLFVLLDGWSSFISTIAYASTLSQLEIFKIVSAAIRSSKRAGGHVCTRLVVMGDVGDNLSKLHVNFENCIPFKKENTTVV